MYKRQAQADRAQRNFFSIENLTALREIALRRCADRTGRLADAARTWEARVIRIAADLMGAIVGLIEIALRLSLIHI